MAQIKNDIEFVVSALRISFAAKPDYFEESLPEVGSVSRPVVDIDMATSVDNFTRYECSVSPRMRICANDYYDCFSSLGHKILGSEMSEVVLANYTLLNDLSIGHIRPSGFTIDPSKEPFSKSLSEHLNELVDARLSESLELLTKSKGSSKDIIVYGASAVLFVRSIDSIPVRPNSQAKIKTHQGRRFLVENYGTIVKLRRSQHCTINQNLRLVVYFVEVPEVIDWLLGKTPFTRIKLNFKEEIDKAEGRIANIFETYLLSHSVFWVSGKCREILNNLRMKIEDDTLEDIMAISESLGVLRTTHLQLDNFLGFINDNLLASSLPFGIGEYRITFTQIKKYNNEVGQKLNLLEKERDVRLSIQTIRTEQIRQRQEDKREKTLTTLSIILGVLVGFEVIASFFSWWLNPVDVNHHYYWGALFLSYVLLIIGIVLWKKRSQ